MAVPADTPYRIELGDREYLFCSAGCLDTYRAELQEKAEKESVSGTTT
jgi:hypothetical protein